MAGRATIIGNRGEDLAVEWLRRNGYMIVARNWRSGRYEIDIIAQRGFSLHFVEVKSRTKGGWNTPEDAITESKSRAVMRAANSYLAMHPTDMEPQFDLIAVETKDGEEPEVRYIPDAMQTHW